jgi:Predicted transcriptional regulators
MSTQRGDDMNTQFRKGVIEMCILALIERKDMYGYEIVQNIAHYTEINEGTVYPILRRLTQEEYFVTYLKESTVGPARKYYHITERGKAYLSALRLDWDEFAKMVEDILRGEEHE